MFTNTYLRNSMSEQYEYEHKHSDDYAEDEWYYQNYSRGQQEDESYDSEKDYWDDEVYDDYVASPDREVYDVHKDY